MALLLFLSDDCLLVEEPLAFLASFSTFLVVFSSIIQIVSHTRLPKTIDFYLINQTSCTYSKTGLGGEL